MLKIILVALLLVLPVWQNNRVVVCPAADQAPFTIAQSVPDCVAVFGRLSALDPVSIPSADTALSLRQLAARLQSFRALGGPLSGADALLFRNAAGRSVQDLLQV